MSQKNRRRCSNDSLPVNSYCRAVPMNLGNLGVGVQSGEIVAPLGGGAEDGHVIEPPGELRYFSSPVRA